MRHRGRERLRERGWAVGRERDEEEEEKKHNVLTDQTNA